MCDFIDAADKSISVQHPKFVDMTVRDRLMAALDVVLRSRCCAAASMASATTTCSTPCSSLHMLRRAGARVHKQHSLHTHAKLILADDMRALVGSMNIGRSAFDGDWDESRRYDAPDSLMAAAHVENDQPHDPDYVHE